MAADPNTLKAAAARAEEYLRRDGESVDRSERVAFAEQLNLVKRPSLAERKKHTGVSWRVTWGAFSWTVKTRVIAEELVKALDHAHTCHQRVVFISDVHGRYTAEVIADGLRAALNEGETP